MGVTFVFRSTVLFSSSLHALPHSAFRASLPVFTGFMSIILQACGLAPTVGAAPRSRPFLRPRGISMPSPLTWNPKILFVSEALAERRRCLPEKMPRANE